MKTLLVIPARYGSTRLPGKPLAEIAGRTMLQRVHDIAQAAAAEREGVDVAVATDDERIAEHCEEIGAKWVLTPVECPTGTDRALAALQALDSDAKQIINLQGDSPLTPPDFLTGMIDAFENSDADVVTPVVRLSWNALDRLREAKKKTPFSGTCVAVGEDGEALWFSKNIIPAIRKEDALRKEGELSPVYRHIGIYGYRRKMLELYTTLPQTRHEKLEGLEQLRVLENGYSIHCVTVDYAGRPAMSGVDSPEDITRAEALIAEHGEILDTEQAA